MEHRLSLFAPVPSSDEQKQRGRAAREQAPVEGQAELNLPAERRRAVDILRAQDEDRVPELVPIRWGRMSVDAFSFYRGSAAVMAADLAPSPRTDIEAQLCGDAHISNFGLFSAPDRRLVFDLNDFDETLPGPFEWDVKRMAASCVLAGTQIGMPGKQRRELVRSAVGTYRTAMNRASEMSALELWYFRLEYDELNQLRSIGKSDRKFMDSAGKKAALRNNLGALDKLSQEVDGARRIIAKPPLIVPLDHDEIEEVHDRIEWTFAAYLQSLPPNRRTLLERYQLADVAHKVVGVGSVGTRCFVVLMLDGDGGPLVLQLKEAGPSVLEPYLGDSKCGYPGERVVNGQHEIQATSDAFLGWGRAVDRFGHDVDFYVRQLWDGKFSPNLRTLEPGQLNHYVSLCGIALARAHARSGQPSAIAGYIGDDDTFVEAMVRYGVSYSKQNDADYDELVAAIDANEFEVTRGV